MVNRNIQMKKKNNEEWENLFPLTFFENVFNKEGQSLNEQFDQLTTDINNDFIEYKTEISNNINSKIEQISNETDQQIKKYHSLRVKPLQLIAHRGFARLAPENTMIAFTNAHSKKAHALECDVQFTNDGVPVIIHDSTVNRTTNGTGRVDSFSLNELKSLDAGSKQGGILFKNTRIPTFEEFLIFSKGRTNRIYPEIKGIRNNSDIETMINLIKRYDMEEMTCIQSFNFDHLDEVRKYSTKINFGYLTENNILETQMEKLENDGNTTILGKYTLFLNNNDLIHEAYTRNIDVGTWTVDDLETINELLDLGIYKIMSNVSIGGF